MVWAGRTEVGGDSWLGAESDLDGIVCGRGQEYFDLVRGVAGRRDQAEVQSEVGGVGMGLGLKGGWSFGLGDE